jgi:hypothetical protein
MKMLVTYQATAYEFLRLSIGQWKGECHDIYPGYTTELQPLHSYKSAPLEKKENWHDVIEKLND